MNELTQRVLFAVPAAILFLWVTWLGGWYFTGLIIIIGMLIQYEMQGICQGAGFKTDSYFPYTIALWILLSPRLPFAMDTGIAIFILFIGIQVFKYHISELVATFFAGLYAPLGLLMLLMVRSFGPPESGFMLTITLLLMVWGNDVFAYFGGKSFGHHLLAPGVSPKKTWEGFFFGIIGAVVGFCLVWYFSPEGYPTAFLFMIPGALLVSIFGPLGDLAESKLKRAAGVKDTSDLLPGHGGFFDRFDALILAAPAFYLYLHVLEILGYTTF